MVLRRTTCRSSIQHGNRQQKQQVPTATRHPTKLTPIMIFCIIIIIAIKKMTIYLPHHYQRRRWLHLERVPILQLQPIYLLVQISTPLATEVSHEEEGKACLSGRRCTFRNSCTREHTHRFSSSTLATTSFFLWLCFQWLLCRLFPIKQPPSHSSDFG